MIWSAPRHEQGATERRAHALVGSTACVHRVTHTHRGSQPPQPHSVRERSAELTSCVLPPGPQPIDQSLPRRVGGYLCAAQRQRLLVGEECVLSASSSDRQIEYISAESVQLWPLVFLAVTHKRELYGDCQLPHSTLRPRTVSS